MYEENFYQIPMNELSAIHSIININNGAKHKWDEVKNKGFYGYMNDRLKDSNKSQALKDGIRSKIANFKEALKRKEIKGFDKDTGKIHDLGLQKLPSHYKDSIKKEIDSFRNSFKQNFPDIYKKYNS